MGGTAFMDLLHRMYFLPSIYIDSNKTNEKVMKLVDLMISKTNVESLNLYHMYGSALDRAVSVAVYPPDEEQINAYLKISKQLIDKGVNIHKPGRPESKRTPLGSAVVNGNVEAVKQLLEAGAEIGNYIYSAVGQFSNEEIAKTLIKYGAKIDCELFEHSRDWSRSGVGLLDQIAEQNKSIMDIKEICKQKGFFR